MSNQISLSGQSSDQTSPTDESSGLRGFANEFVSELLTPGGIGIVMSVTGVAMAAFGLIQHFQPGGNGHVNTISGVALISAGRVLLDKQNKIDTSVKSVEENNATTEAGPVASRKPNPYPLEQMKRMQQRG